MDILIYDIFLEEIDAIKSCGYPPIGVYHLKCQGANSGWTNAVADPGFGQGGPQLWSTRSCRCSGAESGERSKHI